MSRQTGYVEQTVDKDTQFFRVVARGKLDKRGRVVKGTRVRNFNVACADADTAVVTPVDQRGVLPPETKLSEAEYEELSGYARSLGIFEETLAAPVAPPPVPAAEGAPQPKCVASENPEWATASATRKKELMDACR